MSEVYDRARLAELFGDDPGVLAEVERDFLDTARGAEREMRDTDDLRAIARAAHRLKGASGMIGATELGRVAEAVECAAKASDLAGVRRLHDRISLEVQRVADQARIPR
ncbi:Hpt domain-containing protein [Reyranella sp.]|uniref:Hpt domain-containing protein n=1 Tax=Reyranella sp. TaxID=1929291 RepID=UPI0012061A92|nr:Hpt domain-containing protein [Reyranella sp.]TAJ91036.1 MAG: Hpt domain-containing protein [Reyranella sp.]